MYFKHNGIKLFYEKYGTATNSIIILPGWGETRKTWNNFISEFSQFYSIYIVDYPGFGNTLFPSHDLSIYDYTNLIRSFITSLNLEDPLLIGHSFGGRLLILILGYYKDNYKNCILVDSAGIVPKKTFFQKIKGLKYKIMKWLKIFIPKRKRKRYLEHIINKYASVDYKNLPKYMRKTFVNIVNTDLTYYLKYIDANVLLIWGENDTETPLNDGLIMNSNICSSKLEVIKNSGHFPYLDNALIFNQIIYEYTKKES